MPEQIESERICVLCSCGAVLNLCRSLCAAAVAVINGVVCAGYSAGKKNVRIAQLRFEVAGRCPVHAVFKQPLRPVLRQQSSFLLRGEAISLPVCLPTRVFVHRLKVELKQNR